MPSACLLCQCAAHGPSPQTDPGSMEKQQQPSLDRAAPSSTSHSRPPSLLRSATSRPSRLLTSLPVAHPQPPRCSLPHFAACPACGVSASTVSNTRSKPLGNACAAAEITHTQPQRGTSQESVTSPFWMTLSSSLTTRGGRPSRRLSAAATVRPRTNDPGSTTLHL